MIRLVKDSFFKSSINDMHMDEFIDELFPFRSIYIACEDDLMDLASNFQKNITSQDIISLILSEDRVDGFKNILREDDCLLAISKKGDDAFVRRMVIIALKNNLKIYGVSEDFKGGLAILSDDCLVIEENFEGNVARFLKKLRMKINGECIDYTVKGRLIFAVMPGIVSKININVGDEVKEGDKIFVMEILKMENELESEMDGVVTDILVGEGEAVLKGDPLIRIMEH